MSGYEGKPLSPRIKTHVIGNLRYEMPIDIQFSSKCKMIAMINLFFQYWLINRFKL